MNNNRVAQLYGYTVCLVCIVTLLFATPAFVGTLLGNETEETPYGQSISSFEAYKATRDLRVDSERKPLPKSDADLRAEFEAVRADRISAYQSRKRNSLWSEGLLIALAVLLLLSHWRWLRAKSL